jgi:hypothetical protein
MTHFAWPSTTDGVLFAAVPDVEPADEVDATGSGRPTIVLPGAEDLRANLGDEQLVRGVRCR